MKRIQLLIAVVFTCYCTLFAQDNIKRPDTFNYQSGVDAYNEADYQKSMDFFDKELQQNPKNGYALLWKAYIYTQYEKYGQVMTSVNQALKYIPKKDKEWVAMCYNLRANTQAELGDTIKAIADYDLAFKTYQDCDYIFNKCNILHEQGKYNEIDVEVKRAMNVDENNAMTWVYAGRNEDSKGNYDAAIEKYNYSAKLDPKYSSAYSFRAATYINMKKYKEASADVITSLSIDYNNKAFYQLFQLADSAIDVVTLQLKAQQLKEPNTAAWSYYLGLTKAYVDDNASAEPAFREAIRISEYEGVNPHVIYQNFAECLNELGKFNEALEIADKALALDSTSVRVWIAKAESYYGLGKFIPAIDCCSQAIKQAPDEEMAYSLRASLYRCNKQYRNALDDVNTAITLDEESSYYLLQRSAVYRFMGKTEESMADLKAIIERESVKAEDKIDYQSLVYAYAHSGKKAEFYSVIDKVHKGRQTNGHEYDKACMYSLIGDQSTALSHFETALKLGYCEFVHIEHDTDLDNIRGTEKFKALVDEYKQKYANGVSDVNGDDAEYIEEVTEVPFTKESGIYKVKCTINDLPLHFYFDTGASDVTISSVEAQFMLKNDYLKPADIKGKEYYGTASGDIAEGTIIILKKVNFGGLELSNVKASVVHNQKAPLLLGQTVLSKLGKIEIDYESSKLKIVSKKRKN